MSIMKTMAIFSSFASLGLAAFQVNYYYDGGCSQYAATPPNVQLDESCYNYQWTNMNSANIAACDDEYCSCCFYADGNCRGDCIPVNWAGSDCASNWGPGFQ